MHLFLEVLGTPTHSILKGEDTEIGHRFSGLFLPRWISSIFVLSALLCISEAEKFCHVSLWGERENGTWELDKEYVNYLLLYEALLTLPLSVSPTGSHSSFYMLFRNYNTENCILIGET